MDRISTIMEDHSCILTDGAILERLKRAGAVTLHPLLANAALVYSAAGRRALRDLHRGYLDIGHKYNLPMLTFTETWRANAQRVAASDLRGRDVNGDCVRFLLDIVKEYGDYKSKVLIAGLIGCHGDAYRPEEALSSDEATEFHRWQVDALSGAGVDLLVAATIPSCSEALGMARAMAGSGTPYVVSFVLSRTGRLLDGTPLGEAISEIDSLVTPPPQLFMANCCYPSFLRAGLEDMKRHNPQCLHRIVGHQANASPLDADTLDHLDRVDAEEPQALADLMLDLHMHFGIRILGGCCGTDDRHIAAIAERITSNESVQATRSPRA